MDILLKSTSIGAQLVLNNQNKKSSNQSTHIDPEFEVKRMSAKDIQQHFPKIFKELVQIKGLDIASEEVQQALQNIDTQKQNQDSLPNFIYKDDTPRKIDKDHLQAFNPKAQDFLRRAKTSQQALEIINYLEKNKQLATHNAQELRSELESSGLKTFIDNLGGFKKHGYYFDIQQKRHLEEKMKLIKKRRSKEANNQQSNIKSET